MNNILLSIIIPAYSANENLTKLLKTIPTKYSKYYEIIVIDDNSNIEQKNYIENDSIKFYRNSVNVGQGASRNYASKLAIGKYLFFCDSDDYLFPEEFNKFVCFLINGNIDEDLIRIGFVQAEYKNKKDYKISFDKNLRFNDLNSYLRYCFFIKKNTTVTPYSLIYKREVFISHPFNEARLCSEDLDHFFLITENIKSVYITNFIIYYYDNKNSESTTNKYQDELIYNQKMLYKKYIKSVNNKYLLLILCIFYWFIFFKKTHICIKGYIYKIFISFIRCIIPIVFKRKF